MPRAELNPEQKRRLADALRANLARRKQQTRARRAGETAQPDPLADTTDTAALETPKSYT